ncbi:MAG TPA: T9SS type A sorting domain-containing protein, partial [Flavobacteriales bacterium]|nr:T9SS type A sorting domain-containing protein [Flavobacteriales bacterium]
FLSKYNSTGLFLWNGIFNDQVSEQDISNGSIMDAGGNLVHFGSSYNSITFLDLSIAKYHANGSTLWHTQLDMGVSFDKIYGYGKDGSDNYFAYTVNAANQANIVKLDNNGNILYNTPLGTQQQNGFSCDLSGNSFVSGPNFTARDNFDITKFGFMNTVIWTTPIIPASITSYTTLYKTIPDNTGNLYALGTKSGFPSGSKLYVEKIDNAGNRIWGTMIGGYDSMSSSFPAQVLLLDNSGDVVIGTTVKKTDGNNALLIAKFDKTTGTVVFNKIFNGTGSDRSESLAGMSIGSSNEVLTAGFFTPPMSLNPIRPVAKKFDTNGNLVWEYINPDPYTTAPSDKFSNIEQDVDGNYIVAGSIFRQLTTSTSETKLLTLKLNSSGNQVWSQLFEPTYNGNGTTTCLNLFQNRIYVSGTSKMSPGLKEDITLLKYCDNAAPNIVESSVIACNGSSVPLTLSSPFSSYSWQPTNETTGSINATATGNYWVIGTETDGCAKISDTVNVTIKDIPVTPEICMVTVDSLSTHNIIYWDKSAFSGISHFVIYREDVTNIYTAVGSVPYDSLSEYHDYGANPNITTKRYKITAVDTCGTESLKSNYHNTLYVTENGLGDFTWNLYEIESSANPVTTFELLRDDNGTGVWNVIGTTAGTQQILSDPTYSTWPNGQWYVRTVWGITCTPTRAGISTSRSNLRTKSMITDIDENHTGVTTTVFPNPAHDNITVLVGNYEGECTVMIKDAAGRVVKQTTFISNTATISLEGIETGIYFIETGNADFLNVSKVIIN